MSELLHELVETNAQHSPRLPALVAGSETFSYLELWQRITQWAAAYESLLSSRGLAVAGARVAVYLPKQEEAVSAMFGAAAAGGIFVPVNSVLRAKQVSHILEDSGAVILVTSKSRWGAVAQELTQSTELRYVVLVDDADAKDNNPGTVVVLPYSDVYSELRTSKPVKRIDQDVVSIFYTSGSTGRPKGVVLSHRNMVAGAKSVTSYLNNTADDRILAALSLSFDAGFSQLTTAFSSGAAVCLHEYLLPNDVIKALEREQITGLAAVPPIWVRLARLKWPEAVRQSLRYITNTGGAMPTETTRHFRETLPNTDIYLMYGLTEAFRSTYLPPSEVDQRPGSIGKAVPNAEILVLRPDGTECDVDEPGELVHRGALVGLGYWNDAEKTAERFKPVPTRHRELQLPELAVWSGDLVRRDADGYLYFIGRTDDMIKTSGYRVSPTEVEETVYATGLVAEAAAVGVNHDELGQAIVVPYVPTSSDVQEKQIIAACRKELPNFMVPTALIEEQSLPRNPNGKIDRGALKARYAGMFQTETADVD